MRPGGGGRARLGVVVSKRIMKKAVARNTYKRLARDVFRHACAAVSGVDFVVRPRALFKATETGAARAELQDLLRRSVGQCRSRQAAIES